MAESWDEKCIVCGVELEQIHEDGRNKFGLDLIFWCSKCGAIVSFYQKRSEAPQENDWKFPKKNS